MNQNDQLLLEGMGIIVTNLEYTHNEMPIRELRNPSSTPIIHTRGTFYIDEERFRSMCNLLRLVDMIAASNNPVVNEMFGHLVTMLELTKEKSNDKRNS